MPRFTANADYSESDRNPLHLVPGDEVTVGPADSAWPGWVWVSDRDERRGYVPVEILEALSEERYVVREQFDPTVLTVRRGDVLDSLRQIHGWHWCRNEQEQEGWVAGYLLRPLQA